MIARPFPAFEGETWRAISDGLGMGHGDGTAPEPTSAAPGYKSTCQN